MKMIGILAFGPIRPCIEPSTSTCCLSCPPQVDNVVLFGIEAHVCILQTAIDLLEAGKEVHVVADGTSSQRQADRMVAFERLRQMGVFVSTSESIVFQLVGNAKDACFKAISELSKEARPDPGLWVAAKV